jgi:xanthine dehydrogenase accessory factor
MREILSETLDLVASETPFALVTIVAEHGSTPRAAGTQMLVRAGGSIVGTVGGGLLEATMIREAGEVLASGRSRVTAIDLAGRSVDDAAMLCGGSAEILIAHVPAGDARLLEVLRALAQAAEQSRAAWLYTFFTSAVGGSGDADVTYAALREGEGPVGELPCSPEDLRKLAGELARHGVAELPDGRSVAVEAILPPSVAVVCGAGHVAAALAPAAAAVGFEVVVLDDRAEFATPTRFPSAARVEVIDDFARVFADVAIDERTYVVVVTRGHAHDFTVVAQALRTRARYVGLMGSRSKRAKILSALAEDGFSAAEIERLHTPIGIAIGAETPAELAVSITAELIRVRAEKPG